MFGAFKWHNWFQRIDKDKQTRNQKFVIKHKHSQLIEYLTLIL